MDDLELEIEAVEFMLESDEDIENDDDMKDKDSKEKAKGTQPDF